MHYHLPALPAAALALLLTQCQADPPAPTPAPTQLSLLPPATTSGARTFGCLVNGQAWTPAGDPFSGPLLSVQYDFRDSTLSVSAIRRGKPNDVPTDQGMMLNVKGITKPGVFTLSEVYNNYSWFTDLKTNCYYRTSPAQSATLTLTRFDRVNRIVSGRFAFTLAQPGCGTVEVTDGRFDAPY